MMKVRDLPEGDDPVTIEEMTELLVESVPDGDRALARQVVADGILAVELGVAADEPAPRHLAEYIYEDLAEVLDEAAPEERLATLMAEAQVAFVQEQLRAALTLGIARYIKDNPEAREAAAEWLDDGVEDWAARPTAEIQAEVTGRLEELEAWGEGAQSDYPEVWESERLTYVHAKLTMQAAHSGSFDTATGSFRDFLFDVGAAPDDLAIL
jgi:hypothetical protein